MIKQLKIGNLYLKNNLLLAPMAGYSDIGFRSLCYDYDVAMCYSEMISAKGLCYKNIKTEALLSLADNEKPSAIQLFGNESEFIYEAVNNKLVEKFNLIDINMGCPVRKIFNNGEGSALLLNPKLAQEIVSVAKKNKYNLPVTVKMRIGIEDTTPAIDFACAMEEAKVDALTIHGRTKVQMYSGRADLKCIKNIRKYVKIPLIGNGDVVDLDSYNKMLDTGVDGIMIGRGALGKPFIFTSLQGKEYTFDAKNKIHKHIKLLCGIYNENLVANLIKKHICFYGQNNQYSKALRLEVNKSLNLEDIYMIVDKFF